MGYPTKVQLIKRQDSQQWYVNFPAALAQAMEFQKGETVQWIIKDPPRPDAATEEGGRQTRA